MVYMSSSGLDWTPLMGSWFKKKKVKHEDAVKIKRLFDENFGDIYKWCYVSLHMVMEIIQVLRNLYKYNNKCSPVILCSS